MMLKICFPKNEPENHSKIYTMRRLGGSTCLTWVEIIFSKIYSAFALSPHNNVYLSLPLLLLLVLLTSLNISPYAIATLTNDMDYLLFMCNHSI